MPKPSVVSVKLMKLATRKCLIFVAVSGTNVAHREGVVTTVEEDHLRITETAARTCQREIIPAVMDPAIAIVDHRRVEEGGVVETQTRTFRHHVEKDIAGILTTVQREEATAGILAEPDRDRLTPLHLRLSATTTIEALGVREIARLDLQKHGAAGILARGPAVGGINVLVAALTHRPIIRLPRPRHRGLPAGRLTILGLVVGLVPVLARALALVLIIPAGAAIAAAPWIRAHRAPPDRHLGRPRNLGHGHDQDPGLDLIAGAAAMTVAALLARRDDHMVMERMLIKIVGH